MSASHIILDNLPSLCHKCSDLVEVWRSYNKNNCACFFGDTVYTAGETSRDWSCMERLCTVTPA